MADSSSRGSQFEPRDTGALNRVASLLVSAVLCAAGLFKLRSTAAPFFDVGSAAALGVYELGLALLLLGSYQRRWVWRVALSTFVAFGCFAAYRVFRGDDSCGCFGNLVIPPHLMLALDVTICLLLALSFPKGDNEIGVLPITNPLGQLPVPFVIAVGLILSTRNGLQYDDPFMLREGAPFPAVGTDAFRNSLAEDSDVLVSLYGCSRCRLAMARFCEQPVGVQRFAIVCGTNAAHSSSNNRCRLYTTSQIPRGRWQLPVVVSIRKEVVTVITPFDTYEKGAHQ